MLFEMSTQKHEKCRTPCEAACCNMFARLLAIGADLATACDTVLPNLIIGLRVTPTMWGHSFKPQPK